MGVRINFAGFTMGCPTCVRHPYRAFEIFCLFGFIGGIVTVVVDVMILGYTVEDNGPVNIIFTIITFLPYLSVGARRLHDIDKSGWWQLIVLTVIGIILLIIWWATVGKNKKNVHGSSLKLKK